MADSTPRKPSTVVELTWQHDLVFAGVSGEAQITLDSAGVAGPSPVQTLAFALAGCMAMDVVHILKKGRYQMRGLRAGLTGDRAPTEPRRLTAVSLHFTIDGDPPQDAVDRAVQLSRDKYCSVWHSLRQDIPLTVTSSIGAT